MRQLNVAEIDLSKICGPSTLSVGSAIVNELWDLVILLVKRGDKCSHFVAATESPLRHSLNPSDGINAVRHNK